MTLKKKKKHKFSFGTSGPKNQEYFFRMFRCSRDISAETPQKSNRILWNIFVNGQYPFYKSSWNVRHS